MNDSISGIHHVTAIAGPAAASLAFYTAVLGLRLVKKTVNFDDPGTYHLYFGDQTGSPGSIMTNFPFADAQPGRYGAGMTSEVAFAVPESQLSDWMERFADLRGSGKYARFDFQAPVQRFGEPVLRFRDPDGLPLSLVAREGELHPHGSFDGVTLALADTAATARLLTEVFGYRDLGQENGRLRLEGDPASPGSRIDLLRTDERRRPGSGTVHHVAFRVANDQEQLLWQNRLMDAGMHVTEVKDRQYFHSIYFREPGGVLFEIATDPPGFTFDETVESLGSELKLPPWLEDRRPTIESRLPSLEVAAL